MELDSPPTLNATIAVPGRFHAFNLAQQLQKREFLHQLISTYPKFAIQKFGISPHLSHSIWTLELVSRLWDKMPSQLKKKYNSQFLLLDQFDRAVSRNISSDCNLFIGWSGACYKSFRKAKEIGAVTVVDRGSSHMQYQTRILTEEYEKWGLTFSATHPRIYEREIESYSEADYISVPSLYAKQSFLDAGTPAKKLIHVPYGTSLTEFYPEPKEDDVFRVIHCGGITIQKGVQYLLQAFYELQLPNAELWLVGSIALEIEPFLKKYQSAQIIAKGKHPQYKLRYFYSQCSVFCLASINDGFGMVIPQAMACGLPIIHTTNTGGKDIVRGEVDGFCIPIRDVESIKEKILFFYENPDRRKEMGENAREHSKSSLSWDDYGTKIVQAYQAMFLRRP
jgi:glycosyltransferase involved in cell wall biosynthesis